jgi:hypothetical protein
VKEATFKEKTLSPAELAGFLGEEGRVVRIIVGTYHVAIKGKDVVVRIEVDKK